MIKTIKLNFLIYFLFAAGSLSAQQYVWTQKSVFPPGNRYGAYQFSIGNIGYIGSGLVQSGTVVSEANDFWSYDVIADVWTQLASMPDSGRHGATAFSIGSFGYVVNGNNYDQNVYFDQTWQYDPSNNSWLQKSSFPGGLRYTCSSFIINGLAYIGMGYNGSYHDDFYSYDPANDVWDTIANIPGMLRQSARGFTLSGKGYVVGGANEFNADVFDLWQYDAALDSWTQKASFPGEACYGGAVLEINGKILVGTGANQNNSGTTLADFYSYDDVTDTWTMESAFAGGPRQGTSYFSTGSAGFIGLGSSGVFPNIAYQSDLWQLTYTNANTITGKAYYDFNNNQVKDSNEIDLSNKLIRETNTGRIAFTGLHGNYNIEVLDSGNYSVTTDSAGYFFPTPASHAIYFTSINQIDSLNDFAFQAPNQFNDLEVTITPLGAFRPGFDASYEITYSNIGTTVISNPVLYFMLDTSVTYITSSDVPSTLGTDTISWNLTSLNPFQGGSIIVTVNVSSITPIGTEINCPVILQPTLNDINTYNNYDTWAVTVTGSYDPNDIAVNRETLLTTEFPNPPYLDYVIRFQNTGTDTAFTVDVINQLPMEVDVNSFEFVSSSHAVVIRSIPEYNSLGFKFNNILLVDSNMNEAMSHGFIHYRIKPLSTLVQGNQIANSAGIYFDFNAPVLTNTAITTVVTPTGVKNVVNSTASVVAYPNPANDKLNVLVNASVPSTGKIYLTDITGRKVIIQESTLTAGKNKVELNTTKLNAGAYFLTVEYGTKKEVIKVLIK